MRTAGYQGPRKFRALKRATVADNAAWSALAADWAAYLGRKPSASRIVSSFDRVGARDARIARRYNRRMDAEARPLLRLGRLMRRLNRP